MFLDVRLQIVKTVFFKICNNNFHVLNAFISVIELQISKEIACLDFSTTIKS